MKERKDDKTTNNSDQKRSLEVPADLNQDSSLSSSSKGGQVPRANSHVGSFSDSLKNKGFFRNSFSNADNTNSVKHPVQKNSSSSQDGNHLKEVLAKNSLNALPRFSQNQTKKKSTDDNLDDEGDKKTTEKNISSLKPSLLGSSHDEEENIESEGEESSSEQGGFFGGRRRKNQGIKVNAVVKGTLNLKNILLIIGIAIIPLLFIVLCVLLIVLFGDTYSTAEIATDVVESDSDVSISNPEERAFYERIKVVASEYTGTNQTLVAQGIASVYSMVSSYQGFSYGFSDMTDADMRSVATLMFPEGSSTYDESYFKEQLASSFFPSLIPGQTDYEYQQLASDVISFLAEYQELKKEDSYIGGMVAGGSCSYTINGRSMSNIKVRLMQTSTVTGTAGITHDLGGVRGQPIEGEELVDLEKYILGTAYAEIGNISNEEQFKAQLVMSRSFTLGRYGSNAKYENGVWILEIENSVNAQVYCDPDQGCSKDVPENNQWGMVYSGAHTRTFTYKDALPEGPWREWANEVLGQVAVDVNGNVRTLTWQYDEQATMKSYVSSGSDYKDALVQTYGDLIITTATCDVSTGDYTDWKQTDATWGSIVLGGGTDSSKSIHNIGCLATSISMLIMKSSALLMYPSPTLVSYSSFNPGTFVQAMNRVGGFDSGGNLNWNAVTTVVPTFKLVGSYSLIGMSQEEKISSIKNMVNQNGVYCTAEVKGDTGQHWVAIDSISGNKIKMMDPGSTNTDMWNAYDWRNTSRLVCYTTK